MVDNEMELESIDSLLTEIDALKEELKYCNEQEKELVNADIRKLKGMVTSHYTEMHKLEKKEKDMDYYIDRHNKKTNKLESRRFSGLDYYVEDFDDDYLNDDYYGDFEDDTFYEGGREYQWTDTGISYSECINGICWAVKEALNLENGELVYFVVDEDSGDIDWECETPELAIEFIQGKYDDIDDDDYYDDEFYDE